MNRTCILWLCFFWIFTSVSTAKAQGACATLKLTMDQLMSQLVDPTEAGLKALTHPQLSYGHSNGRIENQAEFIQALVSGKSDFKSIVTANFQCDSTSNTAYIRQDLEADIQDGGVHQSIRLHVLYIFTKEKKTWTLLARQAVKRNPS